MQKKESIEIGRKKSKITNIEYCGESLFASNSEGSVRLLRNIAI